MTTQGVKQIQIDGLTFQIISDNTNNTSSTTTTTNDADKHLNTLDENVSKMVSQQTMMSGANITTHTDALLNTLIECVQQKASRQTLINVTQKILLEGNLDASTFQKIIKIEGLDYTLQELVLINDTEAYFSKEIKERRKSFLYSFPLNYQWEKRFKFSNVLEIEAFVYLFLHDESIDFFIKLYKNKFINHLNLQGKQSQAHSQHLDFILGLALKNSIKHVKLAEFILVKKNFNISIDNNIRNQLLHLAKKHPKILIHFLCKQGINFFGDEVMTFLNPKPAPQTSSTVNESVLHPLPSSSSTLPTPVQVPMPIPSDQVPYGLKLLIEALLEDKIISNSLHVGKSLSWQIFVLKDSALNIYLLKECKKTNELFEAIQWHTRCNGILSKDSDSFLVSGFELLIETLSLDEFKLFFIDKKLDFKIQIKNHNVYLFLLANFIPKLDWHFIDTCFDNSNLLTRQEIDWFAPLPHGRYSGKTILHFKEFMPLFLQKKVLFLLKYSRLKIFPIKSTECEYFIINELMPLGYDNRCTFGVDIIFNEVTKEDVMAAHPNLILKCLNAEEEYDASSLRHKKLLEMAVLKCSTQINILDRLSKILPKLNKLECIHYSEYIDRLYEKLTLSKVEKKLSKLKKTINTLVKENNEKERQLKYLQIQLDGAFKKLDRIPVMAQIIEQNNHGNNLPYILSQNKPVIKKIDRTKKRKLGTIEPQENNLESQTQKNSKKTI